VTPRDSKFSANRPSTAQTPVFSEVLGKLPGNNALQIVIMITKLLREPNCAWVAFVLETVPLETQAQGQRRWATPVPQLLGAGEGGRPLHVVCSPKEDFLAIITAYIPSSREWRDDFRTRIEL